MNTLYRLMRVATAVVAVSLLPIVGATSASAAAYYSSTVAAGNNVRACASTEAKCEVLTTTTSTGRMQCWRDGGWAVGKYGSARWFLMELANGQEGFVHSSFVTNQVSVPNCSNLARVRAADWALTQYAESTAPYAYRQGVWGLDWTPGPDREWSGDCAKLPYIAYQNAGVISYPLDHAIGQWQTLVAQGKRGNGAYLPRYGDPVFYSIGNYGHTGLYIGGQKILATQGNDFQNLKVAIYPMFNNPYGTYLGWAKAA